MSNGKEIKIGDVVSFRTFHGGVNFGAVRMIHGSDMVVECDGQIGIVHISAVLSDADLEHERNMKCLEGVRDALRRVSTREEMAALPWFELRALAGALSTPN